MLNKSKFVFKFEKNILKNKCRTLMMPLMFSSPDEFSEATLEYGRLRYFFMRTNVK